MRAMRAGVESSTPAVALMTSSPSALWLPAATPMPGSVRTGSDSPLMCWVSRLERLPASAPCGRALSLNKSSALHSVQVTDAVTRLKRASSSG
eukprot:730-Chlamydomonas_euryale.AAC.12